MNFSKVLLETFLSTYFSKLISVWDNFFWVSTRRLLRKGKPVMKLYISFVLNFESNHTQHPPSKLLFRFGSFLFKWFYMPERGTKLMLNLKVYCHVVPLFCICSYYHSLRLQYLCRSVFRVETGFHIEISWEFPHYKFNTLQLLLEKTLAKSTVTLITAKNNWQISLVANAIKDLHYPWSFQFCSNRSRYTARAILRDFWKITNI